MRFDILPPDEGAARAAKARWDELAKPIGSLGRLEEAVIRIAALTGSAEVSLRRRGVLVFCADNGVVAQGVTQTGSEVTLLVSQAIAAGEGSVSRMAAAAGAEVTTVDIGVLTPVPGALDRSVRRGTADLTLGPAMTRGEAERAIGIGIELVRQKKDEGFDILATGEMGIGNTTTSSAVASALMGLAPEELTGRGAGLSDEGLFRKVNAIRTGLAVNRPDPNDALGVLHKVGGLDIAGMAGVFLGGAMHRVPVLIDGVISAVAALVASRLDPACRCAMLASHVSAEPASRLVLDALGLSPLICAQMRLGEGTGAVCALPLLDLALCEYRGMATFGDIGMTGYRLLGGA